MCLTYQESEIIYECSNTYAFKGMLTYKDDVR